MTQIGECVHGISRLLAEETRFTASSACGAVTIRACIRLLYCIIQTNEQTNKQTITFNLFDTCTSNQNQVDL